MKAECLPFTRIPHTTRLFADFLAASPALQPFYPRNAAFAEWFQDERGRIAYDHALRAKVAAILTAQNQRFGSGEKTLANIARLQNGALAIVTGQQVGLFGGPLYSILKLVHAAKLAAEATAAGVDCVPVFWLATEDHDLAEVNHTSFLYPDGTLAALSTSSHGVPEAPVAAVTLGPEIETVLQEATDLLGSSEAAELLRDAYQPGETLGTAFARLMARLAADFGVILLDGADPAFDAIAAPLYRRVIEDAAALDDALLARGKALQSAGYHQQVKVTPLSTLLFLLQDGARLPLRRKPSNGNRNASAQPEFIAGANTFTAAQLLERLAAAPQAFSPNALLRPVVQDYLLPTLAYVGGAAEVAYFAQAAVVYQALLGRITPILPRFSATLVEPKSQRLLKKYSLDLEDLFHGADALRENVAVRAFPTDVQQGFEAARTRVAESLAGLQESLTLLDPTLLGAAANASAKMNYQLKRLQSRAARAELRRQVILTRHADSLSQSLFPKNALQEREIAGIYFISRYGRSLLNDIYSAIETSCHDHHVLTIE